MFYSLFILHSLSFTSSAYTNHSSSRNQVADTTLLLQDLTIPPSGNDSVDCIEDRAEAIEVGRQCSRRCRKDVPCENARKQCLCDGWCGMSCIKPDLNCVELPKIENGDYFPKSTRFSARVVYHCDPGYYLFGSRERLCQGDEDWSGIPAECLKERKYLCCVRHRHRVRLLNVDLQHQLTGS